MFGYTVTALRVVRKNADDAPLQIDNVYGQGLDAATAWHNHFRLPQSEHQVRARRYWQSASAARPVSRNVTPWVRLEVEYGSNGVPGRVVDTASRAETAQVRPQDATLSTYRHLLTRPRGGSAALLVGEQIGRIRAQAGPLDAFRKAFEATQPDLHVTFENVADVEYWQQFIEISDLVSATLTRQQPISGYLASNSSGQTALATIETTVEPAGRGARWAAARIVPPLLSRAISPGDAFGIGSSRIGRPWCCRRTGNSAPCSSTPAMPRGSPTRWATSILTGFLFGTLVFVFQLRLLVTDDPHVPSFGKVRQFIDRSFSRLIEATITALLITAITGAADVTIDQTAVQPAVDSWLTAAIGLLAVWLLTLMPLVLWDLYKAYRQLPG